MRKRLSADKVEWWRQEIEAWQLSGKKELALLRYSDRG